VADAASTHRRAPQRANRLARLTAASLLAVALTATLAAPATGGPLDGVPDTLVRIEASPLTFRIPVGTRLAPTSARPAFGGEPLYRLVSGSGIQLDLIRFKQAPEWITTAGALPRSLPEHDIAEWTREDNRKIGQLNGPLFTGTVLHFPVRMFAFTSSEREARYLAIGTIYAAEAEPLWVSWLESFAEAPPDDLLPMKLTGAAGTVRTGVSPGWRYARQLADGWEFAAPNLVGGAAVLRLRLLPASEYPLTVATEEVLKRLRETTAMRQAEFEFTLDGKDWITGKAPRGRAMLTGLIPSSDAKVIVELTGTGQCNDAESTVIADALKAIANTVRTAGVAVSAAPIARASRADAALAGICGFVVDPEGDVPGEVGVVGIDSDGHGVHVSGEAYALKLEVDRWSSSSGKWEALWRPSSSAIATDTRDLGPGSPRFADAQWAIPAEHFTAKQPTRWTFTLTTGTGRDARRFVSSLWLPASAS
jgi:hypothetical protein